MGEIAVGNLIYNRYRVLRFFKGTDQGSTGLILLCWDESEKKEYILKTLKNPDKLSEEKTNEFKTIAKNWINLGSGHYTVRAFELFYWDERPFLKLEFVKSSENDIKELKDFLKTPYTNLKVLQLMIQLSLGMQHAISKGLIAHNDIKPSNILYDSKNIKINDFGCAEFRGKSTITNELHGTPEWMAPERFNGQYSEISDIYSFGLIFYYLITQGKHPYHAEDGKWGEAHKFSKIEMVDNELSPIIYKCLEKDPNNRYQSFNDLLNDLILILDSLTTYQLTRPLCKVGSGLSYYELTPTMTTNYDNRPSITSEYINKPTIITNTYDNRQSIITNTYDNRPSITSTVNENIPTISRSTTTYEHRPTRNNSYEDSPTVAIIKSSNLGPENSHHKKDNVHFTVTAPTSMVSGNSYFLSVWAHLQEQMGEVVQRVKEINQEKISTKGPHPIKKGSLIKVYLEIPDFLVEDSEDSIYWDGEIGNATFPFRIHENTKIGDYTGKLTYYINGLQIGKQYLQLKVSDNEDITGQISTSEEWINRAFASYSSKDRDEVLARVHGMQKVLPKLKVFVDVINLRSNDKWKERLKQEIEEADVFYLFWSNNAQKSEWVEKEWRCAFNIKGIDFIDPLPLETPEKAPPPNELSAHKHFYDPILAYMNSRT